MSGFLNELRSGDKFSRGGTLNQELKERLSHVLWIGGATDAGKSTVAQNLAQRHGFGVYHYDETDIAHHEKLANTSSEIRKFNEASLDERWVYPDPQALFERALNSFALRFPLVVDDILALSIDETIIAEGFGLLPELLHPILSSRYQAIWFVPTEAFKRDSMARRGKPSFGKLTSDPEKAKTNLFTRDMLLADYYRKQAEAYGYALYEVEGSRSVAEMTELVDKHFADYPATT
jgi:2-phosphoglycerate kinase